MTQIVLQSEALDRLPSLLDELGARRVLVVTGPEKRFLDPVLARLKAFETECAPFAEVHVPEASVERAKALFERFEGDTVVSLGGGSATGLAKAMRLQLEFTFVAVPTTYAGSEMTNIFGITAGADRLQGGEKKTGRDDRVRPDAVVYDPELTSRIPRELTVASLMNAMSHVVSALSTGEGSREQLVETAGLVYNAALQLVERPKHRESRLAALDGAQRAGKLLDGHELGSHHRLAHALGGRFRLDHAGLHALLLPHTISELPDAVFSALAEATGERDLPGAVFDLLVRARLRTSLRAMDVTDAALEQVLAERPELNRDLALAAQDGRRPSVSVARQDWGLSHPVSVCGDVQGADTVVIALHGRGSSADEVLARVREWPHAQADLAIVAPHSPGARWYSASYRDALEAAPDEVESALATVDELVAQISESVPRDRIVLYGFSQGACLALEWLSRQTEAVGAVIALCGAQLGPSAARPEIAPDLEDMPLLLSISEHDPWVSAEHVDETRDFFDRRGADVTFHVAPGNAHVAHILARVEASQWLSSGARDADRSGFGNTFEVELLPGALPRDQNNPRWANYGLYAEQVNGTAFVAPREHNRRSWFYRLRPSAQQSEFVPLEHGTLVGTFAAAEVEANLVGHAPLPVPERECDFVDGLHTVGGAGSAASRHGYAVHVYVANRDMEGRAFYNADGDLLLIPQAGGLGLLTELGTLTVGPGEVAVIPRGMRFSVLLLEGEARGYIGETFGHGFELPERGPAGANMLTDPRHFRVPEPWCENRMQLDYRITAKLGGRLFEAVQDHSPFDVVAWHGNHCAFAYSLEHFAPISAARFDHPDPSIFTVLSAPMDERGGHLLDFVFFPPRWDVSEETFRPPYFHRNATTEFNGIISDANGHRPPFYAGGWFLTPAMTPHGVRHRPVERIFRGRGERDAPSRVPDDSAWFQFESALPMTLTDWAKSAESRIRDWHDQWGAYRTFFSPDDP
ncbi:MAG: iron-containing alcohol dehydrogenase [Myxococcota bacterium]